MITRLHYFRRSVMITRWRYCLNAVMITRWKYSFSVAMITKWHYCIGVKMVTGCVNWIVNVSYCKKTLDSKKKTSTSPNRTERQLIKKTGGVPQKERVGWTERERKREGGCSAF